MKKILLGTLLMTAFGLMAQTEIVPPQTGFYLSGINGTTTQDENNTLVYSLSDEEDAEDGIYRYINDNVNIDSCETLTIIGAEGMEIGYDPNNFMGMENIISDKSNSLYLIEGGEPINCSLTPGNYKVMLSSFYNFEDEEGESYIWNISFTNNDTSSQVLSYYIVGLNGNDGTDQSNQFVAEEIEGEVSYSLPKFYIPETGSFQIVSSDGEIYGGTDPVTENEGMGFAMLSLNGDPIAIDMTPGYYTVNFVSFSGMAMVSFIYCENQTPANECTYYLTGFGEDIKFTRTVTDLSYEDEETGETIEDVSVTYIIDKVHLTTCPEGFNIVSEEDEMFSFGLYNAMAAVLGDTVTDDNGMAIVCINGSPIFWEMEENDYTVTFFINETAGYINFAVYGEDEGEGGVESIIELNDLPVYYDLQGRKVTNPDKGIYIMKIGNKVTKIAK